jgi:hypothetical protein
LAPFPESNELESPREPARDRVAKSDSPEEEAVEIGNS